MQQNIPTRRKLLKSLALGGSAVVAGRTLPETWSKPVVDAILLPAHAQTSLVRYSRTIDSGPLCVVFNNTPVTTAPNSNPAPFAFDWSGLTPASDARLRVTANGDVNGDLGDESWTIEFNGTPLSPTVGNSDPGNPTEPVTAQETFTIPVSDLTGTSATVTAAASAEVSCGNPGGPDWQNSVEITLEFDATPA